MNQFIITTNNGKQLVTKAHYTRRTQKFISVDTSRDPQWAIRTDRVSAEQIASDCGGTVEPLSAITRFYR